MLDKQFRKMIIDKYVKNENYYDDISELERECKKRGIKYTKKKHTKLKSLGIYPFGRWHIHIGNISIVRGMASSNIFEAFGGKYKEPQRFETAKELIDDILNDQKLA